MQLILDQRSPKESGFDALNQEWATNELMYVDHELGDGIFNVKVTDEESRIPINNASDAQLKRLMEVLNVDPSDGDVIVDSILDWIDTDDLSKLNGAESDYYLSLSPPYRAKNAPLDRVEELLLIRGVTPELFRGTPATDKDPAQPGFADLFTTTTSGAVNVNTASSTVLQTMFGLDDAQVQVVLARRDGADGIPGTEDDLPFRSPDEFFAFVGNMNAATRQFTQGQVTVNSSFFTVKSTGEVGGVKHTIVATLHRDGENIQVVMWREMREGS
jgi:general secretion pathway protein K